jgi:hypothetical protein
MTLIRVREASTFLAKVIDVINRLLKKKNSTTKNVCDFMCYLSMRVDE